MIIDRICSHCGQPILKGALYCLDCGGQILGAAETAGGRLPEVKSTARFNIDLSGLPPGCYLFVVEGLDRGRRFGLVYSQVYVIGREDAQIRLQDPFVSRRHAELRERDGRWFIFDHRSSNGTLVNDRPADGRELADGDLIEVGYTGLLFAVNP
jgi:hypothetical protein